MSAPVFEDVGTYQTQGVTDLPPSLEFPTLRISLAGYSPQNQAPGGWLYRIVELPGEEPTIAESRLLFLGFPNLITWVGLALPYKLRFEPLERIGTSQVNIEIEGSNSSPSPPPAGGAHVHTLADFPDLADSIGSSIGSLILPWNQVEKVGALPVDIGAAPLIHSQPASSISDFESAVLALLPTGGGGMENIFLDGSAPYAVGEFQRIIVNPSASYSLSLPANPDVGFYFAVLPLTVSTTKRVRLGSSTFFFQGLQQSVYFETPNVETCFVYTGSSLGWVATNQSNIKLEGLDPFWNDVVFLLPFEGTDGGTSFPEIKANRTVTVSGSIVTSTAQSKWGNGSALFPANNGYLRLAPSTDFNLPGDFSLEFWMYLIDHTSGGAIPIFRDNGVLVNGGFEWYFTASQLLFSVDGNQIALNRAISSPLNSIGVWRHWALTRQGDIYRAFIDGQQLGADSVSSLAPANTTGGITIGRWVNGYRLNAYLNDMRLTKQARYTQPFTPPDGPLPRT